MYFKVKFVKLSKKTCQLREIADGFIFRDDVFALLLLTSCFFLIPNFCENIFLPSRNWERIRGRDKMFDK